MLVVLKAIFILELLNRLVIFLTAGPKKVKGTHFWFGSVASGSSVCFLWVSFFFRLCITFSGKPLLMAMAIYNQNKMKEDLILEKINNIDKHLQFKMTTE